MDEVDPKYNALNEFLDECINDALQDTTGKFQVGIDTPNEVDYEQYKTPDRFNGFEEDKKDSEGEKMKDYETPFKIYSRPLTNEEIKSYREYEARLGKVKPGEHPPSWKGYDSSIKGTDRTEFYKKYMKPQGTTQAKDKKESGEPHKSPKKSESKSEWAYTNRTSDEVDKVFKPKVNLHQYKPYMEQRRSTGKESYSYKPKFSSGEESREEARRHSEPDAVYKSDEKNPYSFYENRYRSPEKSELKKDTGKYNVESLRKELKETPADEEKKEKPVHGMHEEEVKKELLKLRPPIVDRASWGALPPLGAVEQMKPPADTVVFTINTGTPECHSEEECRRTVKEIQARHMGQGLADIQYNFLVGGDGNLYEGRGWAFESGVNKIKHQGKNYNIAFIGNYQDDVDRIPPHMLGPAQELIIWGNAIRLMANDITPVGEYKLGNDTSQDNNAK